MCEELLCATRLLCRFAWLWWAKVGGFDSRAGLGLTHRASGRMQQQLELRVCMGATAPDTARGR